jgi:hypothetical protein
VSDATRRSRHQLETFDDNNNRNTFVFLVLVPIGCDVWYRGTYEDGHRSFVMGWSSES